MRATKTNASTGAAFVSEYSQTAEVAQLRELGARGDTATMLARTVNGG
jgi:hypothetical protein